MKVYTSYYANDKLKDGYIILGVSRKPYKDIYSYVDIAPSEALLNKYKDCEINSIEFTRLYREEIKDKVDDFSDILKSLLEQNSKKIVLCCYEGKGKFCHRHILAKELEKCGINVEEV